MYSKKILFVILALIPAILGASPYFSPTWGFYMDLPEDYKYIDGDGVNRFSFGNPDGASLDIVAYAAGTAYQSVRELAADVQQRLNSSGDTDFFQYRNKEAAIIELVFTGPSDSGSIPMNGWGLALELGSDDPSKPGPFLIALAYCPTQRQDLQILNLSVLDSIAPTESDRLSPGPITEYGYPRETKVRYPVWGLGVDAWFYTEDEEASQALIDREFNVFMRYADTPMWQDAWVRYYRAIYRDSCDRLADAAFSVERKFNSPDSDPAELAASVLDWVQKFTYERNFQGSDFTNLVSAITDGRGDCDCRAMLWALILNHANIRAAMMVSSVYSHAMGLADLPGTGARFDYLDTQWLVAETTAPVAPGLIAADFSDMDNWIGILLQ